MWKSWLRRIFGHSLQTNEKQERFTVRSRNVFVISQQIAEERHDHLICTEHILIAIVREGGGVAAKALKQLGVTAEKLEPILYDKVIPPPDQTHTIELAAETKELLEMALDEARRQGVMGIGTEHILLGMTYQNKLQPMKVLAQLGITVPMVRDTVHTLMMKSADAAPKP